MGEEHSNTFSEKEINRLIRLNYSDREAQVIAVVCNQFGDTGKGRIIELLAHYWADVVARGTGGANAGHTVVVNGVTYISHLVPASIFTCGKEKTHISGRGVAFDPRIAKQELELVASLGQDYTFYVSYDAPLLLPQHVVMDLLRKETINYFRKIGTTGRGIGPLYEDFVSRAGLCVGDLQDPDSLREKIIDNLEEKLVLIRGSDPAIVGQVFQNRLLGEGRFYSETGPYTPFDIDAMVDSMLESGEFFKDMIADTGEIIRAARQEGQKILLEGAQGFWLSKIYGPKPFVTSSDPSINGLAEGVDLSAADIDLVLGIVKTPYMTKVGGGPFVTEIGGNESESYCERGSENDMVHEVERYGIEHEVIERDRNGNPTKVKYDPQQKRIIELINSKDPFMQGIGVRLAGYEYGATTGRPRRTGWLDLPALRRAMEVNGNELILTKLDVTEGCDEVNICIAYEYHGSNLRVGQLNLKDGMILDAALPYPQVLYHCTPIYNTLHKPTSEQIVEFIEENTKGHVRGYSVGPERNQLVIR